MNKHPDTIRIELLRFGQRQSEDIRRRCEIIAVNLRLLAGNPRPELLNMTNDNVEGLQLALISSEKRKAP